jgi:hypothetical protein
MSLRVEKGELQIDAIGRQTLANCRHDRIARRITLMI